MSQTLNAVVAIDGPAASGKSTVARLLAEKLDFIYVDTGAMYRCYAWAALTRQIDLSSRATVVDFIPQVRFEHSYEDRNLKLTVDGNEPEPHIRSAEVNAAVSSIAAIAELREHLVNFQRGLRLERPLVMEGRDIGTVVFTDTPFKYFIEADPEVRDARRRAQGQQDHLAARDAQDRSRKVSPLTRAADAILIDSTHQTPEQIVAFIIDHMQPLRHIPPSGV